MFCSNSTRMHRNVATGQTSNYGTGRDLSYTFDAMGHMTAVSEADDGGGGTVQVESRLFFDGTVAPTDMSRATDAREKGSENVTSANWLQPILWYSYCMGGTLLLFCSSRCGILGSGLSYAGSYSRVTSETIGRDLNPVNADRKLRRVPVQ